MPILPFSQLLELLAYNDSEHVSITYRPAGANKVTAAIVPAADAPAYLTDVVPAAADAWFGVNPVNGPARQGVNGTVTDVTRLAALWVDLDFKNMTLDTARAIITDLAAHLGTEPSAIVHSGNGLHPYWPVDDAPVTDANRGQVVAVLRRWGRLARLVAKHHGTTVDSVFDLSRILRIPGTVNIKYTPAAPVTLETAPGGPITVDRVVEVLDELGVPEHQGDNRVGDADPATEPSTWRYADKPCCAYTGAMVKAWAADTPTGGRHQWLLAQATRLAAAHALGCLTAEQHRANAEALDARFTQLCQQGIGGDPRPVKRYEVGDALAYGVRQAAGKDRDGLLGELGGAWEHWHLMQTTTTKTETMQPDSDPTNNHNGSDGPEASGRRARITWAHTIDPEPVKWFWEDNGEGRIPSGSLSNAAGREGTGKSSFGLWTTAQITKGTLPGCHYGTPMRVLYVAVEDSWKHTLVPRLIAAGADRSMVGRFEVVEEGDDDLALSLPHDNDLLEAAIVEHNVALVVIDPLMSVIGERIDTHREREVRSALDPLAKLADRTGAVILGIAHFNKSNGTDAASLITGSGAFKNVPRSVFGFARDNNIIGGNNRVMTQVKNSLGRDDLPSLSYTIESAEIDTGKGIATTGRFVFLGESERSVADVLRDNNTGGRGRDDDLDEHDYTDDFKRSWLYQYLAAAQAAGEQVRPKDAIAFAKEKYNISRATVYRLFDKLANAEMVETVDDGTFPKVTYWQLTSETTAQGHQTDETTETTGPDLHKQDETTGKLWDDSETTGESASDQAERDAAAPVVSVVSSDRGDSPAPGAPTVHTPGFSDRVQQALANAKKKNTDRITEGITE